MEYNPQTRRDVLKAAAASGVLLGTGIGASGTAGAQSHDLPNHLLVLGDGTVSVYEFWVGGTVEKTTDPGETGVDPSIVTENATDTVSVTRGGLTLVEGRTTNQADAYRFSGDLVQLRARASDLIADGGHDPVVFVNGVRRSRPYVDHSDLDPWLRRFVLFFGDGTPGTYEFTATGDVEKVTYTMGAPVDPSVVTINGTDTVTNADGTSTVSGRTTDQADAYTFDDEITSIRADPSVLVYFPPVPNLVVRQTGCVEDDYFGPLGEVSMTNDSDQWMFVHAWGDPMGDGAFLTIAPGETQQYWAVWGTHRISAGSVPGPAGYEFRGGPGLVNGRTGRNTVTVTSC